MRTPRLLAALAALATVAALVAAPGGAGAGPAGWWVAGDLHVHTVYSHDAYGGPGDDNTGPDEAYTLGWTVGEQILQAKARGLDFLALTDHNDVRSQRDAGWVEDGILLVPAYENSLRGHAQMLGARWCYDPAGATTAVKDCNFAGEEQSALVNQMADALRADGGVFQVNHPAEGHVEEAPVEVAQKWDWQYGYTVRPDSVEVWNINWAWQPPMPSASSNDDAVRYWEGWLDRGARVAATGGSDNHYRATAAVQGVGQPTTWVFVTERSAQGVLDGIRAGRTTISAQPPMLGGARVWLEATVDGEARMVGDEVPIGTEVFLRYENVPSGVAYRIVTPSGDRIERIVTPGSGRISVGAIGTRWMRAELYADDARDERRAACEDALGDETTYCRNRLALIALSSAIYAAS